MDKASHQSHPIDTPYVHYTGLNLKVQILDLFSRLGRCGQVRKSFAKKWKN